MVNATTPLPAGLTGPKMAECCGIRLEYGWNMAGIWLEYGGIWLEYGGIWLEYGWNMVECGGIWLEYGWDMVEYGWNMAGIWWNMAGTWWNTAGIWLEYGVVWMECGGIRLEYGVVWSMPRLHYLPMGSQVPGPLPPFAAPQSPSAHQNLWSTPWCAEASCMHASDELSLNTGHKQFRSEVGSSRSYHCMLLGLKGT